MSTPPGSPSRQINPIPQKPVLARNNNNNGSGGIRRASLNSPLLDKPLGRDDVNLVEVGGHRFFTTVDTTPPALGASVPPKRYFPPLPVSPGETPAVPRIQPRTSFFSDPTDENDRYREPFIPSAAQMSGSPTLRRHHFPRPPISPDIPADASLRLDAVATPLPQASPAHASTQEEDTRPPRIELSNLSLHTGTSVSSEVKVGGGGSETQDSSDLAGGVVAKPLPPRARPTRVTAA
ncbi:hypothetical protein B566_EDAN018202, partial [Ephemera danica]